MDNTNKGSLIEDVDGKIYSVSDLLKGEMREIPKSTLRNYSYAPMTCLIKDVDGTIYNIINLLQGDKKVVNTSELVNYHYSPKSCLVKNVDGSTENLIDIIFNFSPSEGGTADSKRLRRVEKEIVEARTGSDGIVYGTLDGRLDFEYKRLDMRSLSTNESIKEVQQANYSIRQNNAELDTKAATLEKQNKELKETNDTQDEMINTTMLATHELYEMIEPNVPVAATMMLAEENAPTTFAMGVNNFTGGNKMVALYVAMVQRNLITIDKVPARYREQVEALLSKVEE